MDNQPSQKSSISGTEWFVVILALIFVDGVQALFTLLAAPSAGFTELINEVMEFFIGPSLVFYFWVRGVKLDWKIVVGICAAWFGEFIPGVQVLPLWSLDAVYVWSIEKSKEGGLFGTAAGMAGGAAVGKAVKVQGGPSRIQPARTPRQLPANQNIRETSERSAGRLELRRDRKIPGTAQAGNRGEKRSAGQEIVLANRQNPAQRLERKSSPEEQSFAE